MQPKSMKVRISEANSPKLISVIKSAVYWILFIGFLFLAGNLASSFFSAKWERLIYGIFGTMAAFLATWIFLKIERQTFSYYELIWRRDTIIKFLTGIFIGTCIFIIIILLLVSFSDIQFERSAKAWNPISAFWYLSIIPLALMEEVAFRAYPFLKLNNVFGLRVTQLITAISFALYHIVQGWDFQIAFLGPAIWALVFGLAAIWSKGIALPTGIHVALNLIQELVGMKGGDYESVWVLKHKENASAESIAQTDFVGLITQLLVLVSAILMTEFFIREKQKVKSTTEITDK